MQIAVAMAPGVSADECEAFLLVFGRLEGVEIVRVGARLGRVDGPGGGEIVDALFDDVLRPDVVIVPGGLGCARAADDQPMQNWLRAVGPQSRWVAASSTGTVTVAAAGLLDRQRVATHWLASPILESYGASASAERIVETGNIITCEGHVTAMHVALLLTLRLFGAEAVADVRRHLERRDDDGPPRRWPQRRRRPGRGGPTNAPARPRNRELVAPADIELEPLRPRR